MRLILHAGSRPTAEVLANPSLVALMTRISRVSFAIQSVAMATMVLDLFAGRTVRLTSATMALSVTSLLLMEEELDHSASVITVKSGAYFGIPSAVKASTMSHAASVPLTALST